MVRIGIVGAGLWGAMHARAYVQNSRVELSAVCDLDESRAQRLAAQYSIPKIFTRVEDLLAEELDGVSVATPDDAHTAVVLAAAARGRHILVEKPLATSVEDCQAMIAAAEQAGVILMVDWHNRWNPPMYAAWKAARAGELGEIRYIYYRLSDTVYVPTQMLPWASRSSVMWFLGSHAIDTTCWLMDRTPTRVFCQKRRGILDGLGVDTPDLYLTMLEFEGGGLAVIENTWILPQQSPALIDHKVEILGSRGAVYLDPTHNRAFEKYSPETAAGFPNPSYPDMLISPEIYGKQMGFAVESMQHFVECIEQNKQPLASGADGLLNTRLILAAEESARTGMPVEI
ncbi:MAG: Gfo/Idh/MocA family oxidoreductase [Anaerolineaceae bacterium]|nr:Gfo/Idh/MocA family oxidoreductase [Anaerolineaceae bacterium]